MLDYSLFLHGNICATFVVFLYLIFLFVVSTGTALMLDMRMLRITSTFDSGRNLDAYSSLLSDFSVTRASSRYCVDIYLKSVLVVAVFYARVELTRILWAVEGGYVSQETEVKGFMTYTTGLS